MKHWNEVKTTFYDGWKILSYVWGEDEADIDEQLRIEYGDSYEDIKSFTYRQTDDDLYVVTEPDDFPNEHGVWSLFFRCIIDFIRMDEVQQKEILIRRSILIETNSFENAVMQVKMIAESNFAQVLLDVGFLFHQHKLKWSEFVKSNVKDISDRDYLIIKIEEQNPFPYDKAERRSYKKFSSREKM